MGCAPMLKLDRSDVSVSINSSAGHVCHSLNNLGPRVKCRGYQTVMIKLVNQSVDKNARFGQEAQLLSLHQCI